MALNKRRICVGQILVELGLLQFCGPSLRRDKKKLTKPVWSSISPMWTERAGFVIVYYTASFAGSFICVQSSPIILIGEPF